MGYSTNGSKLSAQGDPGIFGSIGKLAGGIAGLIKRGPAGIIAGAVGGAIGRGTGGTPPFTMPGGARGGISSSLQERIPVPGIRGAAQRLIPGGETGFMTRKKRRRMDVLNVKALRRSTRRLAGFQREANKVQKELRKLAPPARRRSGQSSAHHHHPKG